jgi:anion-transporting  ArsA/GET3 family ATPase
VVRALSRFTGLELLRQLSDFMVQLSGMYDTFKARALEVRRLLQSDATGFVLVTAPTPSTIEEALNFGALLRKGQLPLQAVIANRVSPPLPQGAKDLGPLTDTDLGRRTLATLADAEAAATRDAQAVALLGPIGLPIFSLPRLAEEVFDLQALETVGDLLATAVASGRLSAA